MFNVIQPIVEGKRIFANAQKIVKPMGFGDVPDGRSQDKGPFSDWLKRLKQQDQFNAIQDKKYERLVGPTIELLTDEDLLALPPTEWIIKNIIPATGIGTIFGQSGTFKSFLLLDMLAAISNGTRWFGRSVKPRPTIYIPFEGKGGLPNRVKAWRAANKNVSTGIYFITQPINLRDKRDREAIISKFTSKDWLEGPPVIAIDTLAAAGNGFDENSSKDMGEMVGALRTFEERLRTFVCAVHHSGKDESKGMRGHSNLHGACDLEIECYREENDSQFDAHFKLGKVKEGEAGLTFDFQMERKPVSDQADEDGDWVFSLAITTVQATPVTDNEMDAVLTLIRQGDISAKKIEDTLSHISRPKIRAAITNLKNKRTIKVVGKGAAQKLHAM